MRVGFCNVPVKVERATLTRDDFGHQTKAYSSHLSELYVAIRTPRASDIQSAEGDAMLKVVQFTTPYHESYDIAPGDRIVWDGSDWEIITAHDRDGYRNFIDITARQVTR
tara:strand:- start:900 stop:1229 length:330 start_codon:yes stop_codon:yes gene_type:complete